MSVVKINAISVPADHREELEKRNGHIVGSVAYSPGAREFNVEMLTAQKWIDAKKRIYGY